MTMTRTATLLAGAAIAALSFNAAAAPQTLNAKTCGLFYNAVAATGVPFGNSMAGGGMETLEIALKEPSSGKAKVVYYPKDATTKEHRLVFGISPDKNAPILACLEGPKNSGQWNITNDGRVIANNTVAPPISGFTPCQSFLRFAMTVETGRGNATRH